MTITKAVASTIILTAAAFPAHAALSGFYDSAEQINTIITNADVGNALRQLPIRSMEREDARSDGAIKWEIEAEGCDLDVYLTPVEPDGLGKRTYTIEVGKACEQ